MAESKLRMQESPRESGSQRASDREREIATRFAIFKEAIAMARDNQMRDLLMAALAPAKEIAEEIRRSLLGTGHADQARHALRSIEVATDDIERDYEDLTRQIQENHFGGNLICRNGAEGRPVPLSSSEIVSDIPYYVEQQGDDVQRVPFDQGIELFCDELEPFLQQRIAGTAHYSIGRGSGIPSPSPFMLSVRVHSHTTGARVSYSPAYFHNYVTFAAPTSPVRSMIMPGRYIFMLTSSGQGKAKYDQGVFDIPPSFDVHLMV